MKRTCVHIEGALISSDLLEAVETGQAEGQRPQDFGLDRNRRLTDEIAAAWTDARAYWEAYQHGLRRVNKDDPATSVTREQWMLPLLRSLDYDQIIYMPRAAQIGGRTYFISHRTGADENAPPLHIEGCRTSLDRRSPTGRPRLSPHALVQEYLNRTEHVWGAVANGHQFRFLRDSSRMARPSFIEFDLSQMMQGEQFAEFGLFYRLAHRTRLPRDLDDSASCLLETYYQQSIELGGRVREHLRDGVEEALKILGNGFLTHPANEKLRGAFRLGALSSEDYYRQLLRLIYRFLFLLVSEERGLTEPDDPRLYRIYHDHYSISRLRPFVEQYVQPEGRYSDLWQSIRQTFRLYREERLVGKLGMAPLNGDLFGEEALPDLETAELSNTDLLRSFAHLSLYRDGKVTRRVNYAHLDVEELGSVYESLLEYHPSVGTEETPPFQLLFGSERKSTGSYYTRPELVHELIESALVPVIAQRLSEQELKVEGQQLKNLSDEARQAAEKTLLSLKVCDPACGSGHFLLAAARRIGMELARVRSSEEQPTPTEFRQAVRDVIRRCIYGVDLNPLAVDLCKFALWLEGHTKKMPLSFLDHRIRCGNSLIGVFSLDVLQQGIPDDAFKAVTGDDREVAKLIRKWNREERKDYEKGQERIAFDEGFSADMAEFAEGALLLDEFPDDSVNTVQDKLFLFEQGRSYGGKWWRDWTAANLWTAAFFVPLTEANDPTIPTYEKLMRTLEHPSGVDARLTGRANALAVEHRFFHWPLEFPEVFERESPGFDVVLGNPPWERIKLQEKEFFAVRDPEIANALNKAARQRLIDRLEEVNLDLAREFVATKHHHEAMSKFVRNSDRFLLTAVGDVNTYALFAELARELVNMNGRAGVIVPTGIATDDTCKMYFADLVLHRMLVTLYDFENREKLFPAVDSRMKFSLLTLGHRPSVPRFAFFLTRAEHLGDHERVFSLHTDDLKRINPNTHTCPVFRTRADAELTRKIYQRVPVLVNERTGENPWGISFMRMLDMANDSHLFLTEPEKGSVPLYEAKMMHQFEHRWATYLPSKGASGPETADATLEQKQDPNFTVRPRYWVSQDEVETRLSGKWEREWLIGFRDVTNATNERTAIFSLLPRVGVGHKIPLVFLEKASDASHLACFVANVNCLVLDYAVRQKIGGTSLSYFILRQLPVLPPEAYTPANVEFIAPRVLELVYTAWDMQPFAEDMGYDGPPFRWDEDRRAILRAELDAYYARLYGLTRDELRYILDPQDVRGEDFPGETFRVLKEKEIRQYGEYRTRRLVLEAWERLG